MTNLKKKNWTKKEILTDWVLRWLYLWLWELELQQNKRAKGVLFFVERRRRRRKKRNEGGRKGGRATYYNLNIINGFLDRKLWRFFFINNFIGNIGTSDLSTKISREYLPIFYIPWIPPVIPYMNTGENNDIMFHW
jgi:hypothetical protein